MASFKQYDASGGASENFSIKTFSSDEIKVYVDNVLKTAATHYNITSYTTNGGTVTWIDNSETGGTNHTPSSGTVRIVRDTDVSSARATYAAGSSIKADDLNDNQTQALRSLEEQDDQLIQAYDFEDGVITTAKLAADAVTSPKIADDAVKDEHIKDGNVTTAKIADDAITNAKIADDAIQEAQIANGAVTPDRLNTSAVTTAKIADNAVTTAKIADNAVTTAKIADLNITQAKIANDSVTYAKIQNVTATNRVLGRYASGSGIIQEVTPGSLRTMINVEDGATADQTAAEIKSLIAGSPLDASHLAANSVDSSELVDGSIDTSHIGATQVTDAKLASNAVTTSKITDANVTTVKVADSNITLAKLASDLKQTTISNSDTQLPTSGAVVDYVAAQIAPLGGLEVIATDAAFPNTQPSAGVVISIADAGGIVVDGSGSSTTGRTVGGSTVTINGINSAYNNSTVTAGVGFLVSSTGSGQIYNFHKSVVRDQDILSISSDINDFANRYRVASSAPSSNNDAGDLYFNTTSNKLFTYNGTNSAWEEAQSVGNFYINTISSYSGTGGNSASFNGSAYRFVLSNAPANAEQLLVSVNGVVQKPNSGTSQPGEGFAIDGSSIIFSAAPATGSDFFIITIGASVNIGAPSDGTVTADKIASGAVTTVKIADDAVAEANLKVDNTPTNDYVLTAKSSAAGGLTWAATAPGVGGATGVDFNDDVKIRFGTGNDLELYHDGTSSYIVNGTGNLHIRNSGSNNIKIQPNPSEEGIVAVANGAVELYYNGTKQFETIDGGVRVPDSKDIQAGDSGDLKLYHDGTNSYIRNLTNALYLRTGTGLNIQNSGGTETYLYTEENGAVFLRYDNATKLETQSGGVTITGNANFVDNHKAVFGAGSDLKIYHDGTHSYIDNTTGLLSLRNGGAAGNKIYIQPKQGEYSINALPDGAVELYYDNSKVFETYSSGITVLAGEGLGAQINIYADQGDDDADKWRFDANSAGGFYLQNYTSGAWETNIKSVGEGPVELYYDNVKTFSTRTEGIFVKYSIKLEEESGSEYYQLVTNSYGGLEFQNETTKVCEFTDSNTLDFPDNNKIQLGTGSDFAFWHDGTDSKIYNSTGDLYIQNSDSNTDAKISIRAKGGENSIQCFWNGGVSLYHNNSNKFETTSTGIVVNGGNSNGRILPGTDGEGYIGDSGTKWNAIYASNGTIQTSDRNEKNTILESDLGLSFVNKLKPVSYKWNKNDGNTYYGLIAQDVEETIINEGKSIEEFGGLKKPANDPMGLNYSELISPLIKAIQELSTKIETLETKVAALEAK